MSKKIWSISTTVRNPYRMLGFLSALSELEGEVWNRETQKKFQVLLIQKKLYIPELNGLNDEDQDLLKKPKELSYEQAERIFNNKDYVDSSMRGRTSYSPLEKQGLTFIHDKKICISPLGKLALAGEIQLDELCFRSFVKWQYPNPLSRDFTAEDGYNTRPFITTLRLIRRVNELCTQRNQKAKGISKEEFGLFALSLINYNDLESTAEKLLEYRNLQEKATTEEEKKNNKESYLKESLSEFDNATEKNIKDYTDNAIRYFRLTKYIYIRGGGYYIDLEPRRQYELTALFDKYNGSAQPWDLASDYENYLSQVDIDPLPWETKEALSNIAQTIIADINQLQRQLDIEPERYSVGSSLSEIKRQIESLRNVRTVLQQKIEKRDYSVPEKIDLVIQTLQNIRGQREKASILLEQYSALALTIINDAKDIHPNYPVGDDNEPTFTAAANIPDIEYEYESFAGICEVTMLTGRDQWYNEGQPVQRHLRDFENRKENKQNYCVFISPRLHRDTINTFWTAVKYEYEGKKQRIVPLSISQLIKILAAVKTYKLSGKSFSHTSLKNLYDEILDIRKIRSGPDWVEYINSTVSSWIAHLTN